MPEAYDALLIVSFGGPEGPREVLPFLENVLRGRNVPRERMLEVAEHYQHFGGVSPLNGQNRELIAALEVEFKTRGPRLPIYWGNRNWHPLLVDTLKQMAADGVRRALAYVTSAFSSYSGCRQYREDIERARATVGETAPQVDKLRGFYNHPGFLGAVLERTRGALAQIPEARRDVAQLIFTAHSIPAAMAAGCDYESQLREASEWVAAQLEHPRWTLAYQSRSGPPTQPWLEPDIGDCLRGLDTRASRDVVIEPIGFLSDHMEVIYDLDTEARAICDELGLNMVRAETVGNHPLFIQMIRELVLERIEPGTPQRFVGAKGPRPDVCAVDCCRSGRPG